MELPKGLQNPLSLVSTCSHYFGCGSQLKSQNPLTYLCLSFLFLLNWVKELDILGSKKDVEEIKGSFSSFFPSWQVLADECVRQRMKQRLQFLSKGEGQKDPSVLRILVFKALPLMQSMKTRMGTSGDQSQFEIDSVCVFFKIQFSW